jgi:hypothetical protein
MCYHALCENGQKMTKNLYFSLKLSLASSVVFSTVEVVCFHRTYSVHIFSFFQSGTFDAVTIVHSYDNERSAGHQKTRLSALNVIP